MSFELKHFGEFEATFETNLGFESGDEVFKLKTYTGKKKISRYCPLRLHFHLNGKIVSLYMNFIIIF